MGISVLQPSLSGGEMAPTLAARVDLARYSISLKTCRNFTVMQHGGVRNRPGTRFVNETDGSMAVRFVRFKFSISDACLLVFTNNLMRVVVQGAYVLDGSGNIYQIATPWSSADLLELNYTQSADVMTFVHSLYRPRELKRFANNNWTITEPSYLPTIAPPASANVTTPAGTGSTKVVSYQVTAARDDTDTIQESLPTPTPAILVFSSDPNPTVTWAGVAGATYYNIYKDDTGSGIYGFIGRAATNLFVDRNIAATKTDTPPSGVDPFVGAGNYPSAVGYYQQRKVYGGSLNKPQTLYFSRAGQFNNYGYSTPAKDDDAITWTMASTEINRVLNFVPLRQLLTLTNGSEWAIDSNTAAFTGKTISGNPQSYNGSGFVPPLLLNDTALYLQARGQAVSSLNYSLESDGIASQDLTIWASHLFRDYNVVNWAYQKLPDSIVWAVRSDGILLGLTYLKAQDIVAWHRHDTDGFIESVSCIPEGNEDVIYLCVRRIINGTTKRYIERMQSRNIALIPGSTKRDVARSFFVDCGLTYDGWINNVNVILSSGVTWQYPEQINLAGSGTAFSAGDVGKQYALRDPLTQQLLYMEVVAFISATQVTVIPVEVVPEGLRNVHVMSYAKCARTLSGISHLEGKKVSILADGNVVGGFDDSMLVVTGGAVTLPFYAAVVHVGLQYTADIETLRINVAGQETLNDKNKGVNSVTLVVDETRGLYAGSDADHLFEHKERSVETYVDPINLITGMAEINITGTWGGQGHVMVRQLDPLPVTILGIIPELTIAGKA